MFESDPLYHKKKPYVWKYHLIFFFCNFIIDFFCLGSALRMEMVYEVAQSPMLQNVLFQSEPCLAVETYLEK